MMEGRRHRHHGVEHMATWLERVEGGVARLYEPPIQAADLRGSQAGYPQRRDGDKMECRSRSHIRQLQSSFTPAQQLQ